MVLAHGHRVESARAPSPGRSSTAQGRM